MTDAENLQQLARSLDESREAVLDDVQRALDRADHASDRELDQLITGLKQLLDDDRPDDGTVTSRLSKTAAAVLRRKKPWKRRVVRRAENADAATHAHSGAVTPAKAIDEPDAGIHLPDATAARTAQRTAPLVRDVEPAIEEPPAEGNVIYLSERAWRSKRHRETPDLRDMTF